MINEQGDQDAKSASSADDRRPSDADGRERHTAEPGQHDE
jgi:hypothetical protein